MRLEDLFVEPEVIDEAGASDADGTTQTTQLCRSRLEQGCYMLRQTTDLGDGKPSEQRVYLGSGTVDWFAAALAAIRPPSPAESEG